jgi:hypothetical protein
MKDTLLARAGKLRDIALGVAGRLGTIGLALATLVIMLLIGYFGLLASTRPVTMGDEVTLDQARRLSDAGEVFRATLYDEDARVVIVTQDGSTYFAAYPKSDAPDVRADRRLHEVERARDRRSADGQGPRALRGPVPHAAHHPGRAVRLGLSGHLR